jgi:hypothetical protein
MKKMEQKRTRNKQIILRSTEEEYGLIQEKVKKSKLKQNDFLLKSALGKDIIVIDGLKDLLLELVREGKNLNQIAKSLNRIATEAYEEDKFEPTEAIKLKKIIELKEKLIDLWAAAEEILKEVKE